MKQFTPMSARHYLQNLSIQKLFIALDCFRNSYAKPQVPVPVSTEEFAELMELFLCNRSLSDCAPETKLSFGKFLNKEKLSEITDNQLIAELASAVDFVLEKYL